MMTIVWVDLYGHAKHSLYILRIFFVIRMVNFRASEVVGPFHVFQVKLQKLTVCISMVQNICSRKWDGQLIFTPGKTSFYRAQRSYGKVMFLDLHLSVILFTGGCLPHTPPGRTPPSGQTPPVQTLPRADTPRGDTLFPWADSPPPVQCMLGYGQQVGGTHPTGMQSYWNFIFQRWVSVKSSLC